MGFLRSRRGISGQVVRLALLVPGNPRKGPGISAPITQIVTIRRGDTLPQEHTLMVVWPGKGREP